MRAKLGLTALSIVLAALGFAAASLGASAHQSGCHSQHTCPSDHHTYIWTDPGTGLAWDCVRPGASEYDPSRDMTTIVWEGLTYYCRAATSAGTTTTTTTTTTSTTTTFPTTTITTTTIPVGTTTTTTTTSTTTTTAEPGAPSVILPDADLTPGALNPKVRQATIKRTICKTGWTKTIRPPVSYTNLLKIKQMVIYGETGSPSEYEEDHFIPLELGGAPKNPKNLWPEPRSQSKLSDPLETKLKRQVCKRLISLKKARAAIRNFKNTQG